jgi:truncated hemoglobin YjbI
MEAAVRGQGLPDELAEAMSAYFANAAAHMVNTG